MILRIFRYVILFFILYIFLYNPIFKIFGFGLIKVLLLFSIVYLLYKRVFLKSISLFRVELIFTIILIFYTLIIAGLNNGSLISTPYIHFIWYLESFIIPIFLITYFRDIFNKFSLESIVVPVGFIASIITLFLVLNPELNLYVRKEVIIDTLDTVVTGDYSYRGFTIAESSSYSYGIVQGIILALCIFSLKRSMLYAIPLISLFASIFFNARIGFSVLVLSLVLSIGYRKISIRNIFLIIGFAFLIVFTMLKTELFKENEYAIKWGMSFFTDSFSLLTGKESDSNYNVLFRDMIQFPDNFLGLTFGEGHSLFGKTNGSDIGYINIIFTGGFIYLLFMLLFLAYMFVRNCKFVDSKIYPILFLLTLLIVNIKGMAFFVPNGFVRLMTLYYILTIYNHYNNDYMLDESKS